MPPYRFRLETLLKVRIADRQQRRIELAEAYQVETLLEQQGQQLALERETMRRRARLAAAPGPIDVDALVAAHRYELLLERQVQRLQQQALQLLQEIERRREKLVEADRQVRALEKLRDRQRAAHRAAEAKQELRELDEVASRSTRGERT